jgi:hypothetical protein
MAAIEVIAGFFSLILLAGLILLALLVDKIIIPKKNG